MRWSLNRVLKATVRGARDSRVSLISGLSGTKQSRRRPGRPTTFSSVPGTPRQGRMSHSYADGGSETGGLKRKDPHAPAGVRIFAVDAARAPAGVRILAVDDARPPADEFVTDGCAYRARRHSLHAA